MGGAWGIKRGKGAVGSQQEAVTEEARVKVITRDRPRRVDRRGKCAVDGDWDINVVKVPSGVLTKPWLAKLASV